MIWPMRFGALLLALLHPAVFGSAELPSPTIAPVPGPFVARQWIMIQFRATALFPGERARLPAFFDALGRLPGADRTLILNPMVDLFRLSEDTGYRTIPDKRWAEIDGMLDLAHRAGVRRILPTFTFKIDPDKTRLARFCAQMPSPADRGPPMLAIANGSCLPAYADPVYREVFNALLAQAVKHFEARYGVSAIGYEPAGGVAGEIDWKGTDLARRPVYGDISPAMQQRFRTYLLAGRPASAAAVVELNSCLGTHFASTNDITIPTGTPPFRGAVGHQYAAFRADLMGEFYREARNTVKKAAPDKLFSLRMGSLIDPTSVLRGTLFFQQFARVARPDLMISDSSTFNHNYEVPIVAATGAGNTIAWGTVADKFSTYAHKKRDYRFYIDRQLSVALGSGGYSVIGFFVNPGEMAADAPGWTYLTSVARRLAIAPARIHKTPPARTVTVPISHLLDDYSSPEPGVSTLQLIRSGTKDFRSPAAIRFENDIAPPSPARCKASKGER